MSIVVDLGQVSAIKISSVAPTNTKLLWYDTNVTSGSRFKYYDVTDLEWKITFTADSIIDDSVVFLTKTWSSEKINTELGLVIHTTGDETKTGDLTLDGNFYPNNIFAQTRIRVGSLVGAYSHIDEGVAFFGVSGVGTSITGNAIQAATIELKNPASGLNTGIIKADLLVGGVANQRVYQLPPVSGTFALEDDLTGYVPVGRLIEINGVSLDLSANRVYNVGTVTNVSGTTNRISVSSGSSTPVIDIDANYIGQLSITTLGTITAGVWNGTQIADAYIASAATWNDAYDYSLIGHIPLSEKAANNGVATLDAGGKVPISQLPSTLMIYKGTWNAATNIPTLADGTGDAGWTYRVSTTGSQNLGSGVISFEAGDYIIYNGTTWEKSDGADAVTSVNGQQGVVVLNTSHISEVTNLYYTDARARAAISLTTTGTSGDATYNSSTGVFNIPNYSTDLSGHVPYTGATANANLGLYDLTATNIVGATGSFGELGITGEYTLPLTDGTATYVLTTDGLGTVSWGPSAIVTPAARTLNTFTATAAQTTFTIPLGYVVGLVDVYVNGVKLAEAEYTATNGTTVVITGGVDLDDIVEVFNYNTVFTPVSTLREVNTFTATAAQTTFTLDYTPGLIDVYYNGSKLTSAEYISTNGTDVELVTPCILGDIVEIIAFTYDVSGLSGVSGTANKITKFSSGSTLVDSSITDTGSLVTFSTDLEGTSATFSENITVRGITVGAGSSNPAIANPATILGYEAGLSFTVDENENTAIGYKALRALAEGFGNTAVGSNAMTSAISYAEYNTAVGSDSLWRLTTGVDNTAIGYSALDDVTTGSDNVALGYGAGGDVTTGSGNVFIGYNAFGTASMANNIIIKSGGGVKAQHDGTNWTFTGGATFSGRIISTQGSNTKFFEAVSATTGFTYLDVRNTSGQFWLGVESSTGGTLLSGASAYSTVLSAMTSTSLHFGTNSAIRYTIDASGNNTWTGIGTFSINTTTAAVLNLTNSSSTGYGLDLVAGNASYFGLRIRSYDASTTAMTVLGNGNTTIAGSLTGTSALFDGTSVPNIWAMNILGSSTSGQSFGLIVSASTTTADNALLIRSQNTSNLFMSIRGGDGYTLMPPVYANTTASAANVFVSSDGGMQRSTSSLKYKKDVVDYDKGLDIINQMRPVYYKGKSDVDGDKRFAGLIAEEIHALGLTEFVQYAEDESPDALAYTHMAALFIKGIQEQQIQISDTDKSLQEALIRIEELEIKLKNNNIQ
jgi:hypothetical protein